jgi:hypothetical protein
MAAPYGAGAEALLRQLPQAWTTAVV